MRCWKLILTTHRIANSICKIWYCESQCIKLHHKQLVCDDTIMHRVTQCHCYHVPVIRLTYVIWPIMWIHHNGRGALKKKKTAKRLVNVNATFIGPKKIIHWASWRVVTQSKNSALLSHDIVASASIYFRLVNCSSTKQEYIALEHKQALNFRTFGSLSCDITAEIYRNAMKSTSHECHAN